MNTQLQLPITELLTLGFKGRNIDGDEMNSPKRVYEAVITNGTIYYNPEDEKYTWYCAMIVGDSANHCNLNIETLEELKILLRIFNIK